MSDVSHPQIALTICRTSIQLHVASVVERVVRLLQSPNALFRAGFFTSQSRYERCQDITFTDENLEKLVKSLQDVPEVFLSFFRERGEYGADREITMTFNLNCEEEVIRKKVDGKYRWVPKPASWSSASLDVHSPYLEDEALWQQYPLRMGQIFEALRGEYGYGRGYSFYTGFLSKYDRRHSSLFEPLLIHWANFFGPSLVERFGRDRLLSAPAHRVLEMSGGSIVLIAYPYPWEREEPWEDPLLEVRLEHGGIVTLDMIDELPYPVNRLFRLKHYLGIKTPSERDPAGRAAWDEEQRQPSSGGGSQAWAAIKQEFEEAARIGEEMERQAAGTVEGVGRIWDYELDYSPASLTAVDRIIDEGFDVAQMDAEELDTAIQAFGAYVGEVIVRNVGGEWWDEDLRGQPVILNIGPNDIRTDPFGAVEERFERWDQAALAEYYQRLEAEVA